jgi:CheY-like chemotaxis protein
VRLPLAPIQELRGSGSAQSRDPNRPRDVLLVEDNQDVAELMAEALVGLGHWVRVAGDGESALEEVRRAQPEVMLIDIGLPGMDGYELVRELHQRVVEPRPLLVALTGYGSPDDRQRTHEAGFDEHLVKPVPIDRLSRVLAASE